MRRILIREMDGKDYEAFIPENPEELQTQLYNDKKQKFKEHLYITFLTLGVVSFGIGIFLSLRRINANK